MISELLKRADAYEYDPESPGSVPEGLVSDLADALRASLLNSGTGPQREARDQAGISEGRNGRQESFAVRAAADAGVEGLEFRLDRATKGEVPGEELDPHELEAIAQDLLSVAKRLQGELKGRTDAQEFRAREVLALRDELAALRSQSLDLITENSQLSDALHKAENANEALRSQPRGEPVAWRAQYPQQSQADNDDMPWVSGPPSDADYERTRKYGGTVQLAYASPVQPAGAPAREPVLWTYTFDLERVSEAAKRHELEGVQIVATRNERPGQGMVPLYAGEPPAAQPAAKGEPVGWMRGKAMVPGAMRPVGEGWVQLVALKEGSDSDK